MTTVQAIRGDRGTIRFFENTYAHSYQVARVAIHSNTQWLLAITYFVRAPTGSILNHFGFILFFSILPQKNHLGVIQNKSYFYNTNKDNLFYMQVAE